MKWLIYIIIAIIAFCSGIGIGRYNKENIDRDTIFSTSRTIDIRHDTLLSINPLPILAYFDSIKSLRVKDTILAREVKVYGDSTYKAVVSGFDVNIDSLLIFPKTITIHDTKTKTILAKQRKWNIGLQAGYGITRFGLSPYAGVGISYRLF